MMRDARSSEWRRCMMVIRLASALFRRVLQLFAHHSCTVARLVSLATSLTAWGSSSTRISPPSPCDTPYDAGGDPVPGVVVLDLGDAIHVADDLPAVAPAGLIPARLHEPPAVRRVAVREPLPVGGAQELQLWAARPRPRRQADRRDGWSSRSAAGRESGGR